MRKYLLLSLIMVAFSGFVSGQNCNPDFSATPFTPSIIKFSPALNTDSALIVHSWDFGDGTSVSGLVYPSHGYFPGTYIVKHVVVRHNNAGVVTCMDSATLVITIAPTTSCALVASFGFNAAAGNPREIHFSNTSVGGAATDSIRWTFGDGTSGTGMNPTHTYANAGVYHVCLRVQKRNPNGVLLDCVSEVCHDVTIVIPTVCNLSANFTFAATASNPREIHFVNTTTGGSNTDSIRWSFGDGTTGTGMNPTHVYATAGVYHVCLRVQRREPNGGLSNCVSEICHDVTIVAPCTLTASFTFTAASNNPREIHFTNTSAGGTATDSIRWTFGDGTSGTGMNPTHTYANAGVYHVCLRVQKREPNGGLSNCVSEICHDVTIVAPCTLTASFTFEAAPNNPREIHFTNTSAGGSNTDSVTWTFGDGTVGSGMNPTHVYANAGVYHVCIRVQKRGPNGVLLNCASGICHDVTVVAPTTCTLTASFTFEAAPNNPREIHFTNTSTGGSNTDSVTWTFGDGTVGSGMNPTHVYANAGVYHVCLRVQRRNPNGVLLNCISEICHNVTVVAPTVCTLTASFTFEAAPNSPREIHFTNTSTGGSNTDSIRWTFGDGTSGTGMNPTHVYANAGVYHVCLRVQKRTATGGLSNCVSEICHDVTIIIPTTCNLTASFTFIPATNNPREIHFTNTSTGGAATDSIRWTFGDGTAGTGMNPTHVYANAGVYHVCLRVQKRNPNGVLTNCVSEVCRDVNVVVPCNIHPTFTHHADSINRRKVYFTNTTPISNTTGASWSFGDGSSSSVWNPVHEYANPGRYYVCLTITSGNCVTTHCDSLTVEGTGVGPCANTVVSFFEHRDSLHINRITFTAVATSPIIDQLWTIKKLPNGNTVTLHVNNPTYVFNDTGDYRICLRATFANNCVKEVCKVIHFSIPVATNTPCNMELYPNPAQSVINAGVNFTNLGVVHAYIYNTMGILVRQVNQTGVVGHNVVTINIATLPAGLYTFKILHEGQTCTSQFYKQ